MLILTESGTDTGLNNASASLLVPLSAAGEQRFNTPQKSMGLSRKENPFLMIYELEPYKKVIGSYTPTSGDGVKVQKYVCVAQFIFPIHKEKKKYHIDSLCYFCLAF